MGACILSDKLYSVINTCTKSMWIKSCIYITGGLRVILGDADISYKLGFLLW